jgi:hypothetical protein
VFRARQSRSAGLSSKQSTRIHYRAEARSTLRNIGSATRNGRHRLNRGGNRQLNRALYTIALTRMAHDPRTKTFVTEHLTRGKTKKETIRILKRAIAREVYRLLKTPAPTP